MRFVLLVFLILKIFRLLFFISIVRNQNEFMLAKIVISEKKMIDFCNILKEFFLQKLNNLV
jgi:hypothetical protein